jgi:hypothetical protein
LIWEEASEAILNPDATMNYWPKGMDEFAGKVQGGKGVRGWMRGWVEGRTLVRTTYWDAGDTAHEISRMN